MPPSSAPVSAFFNMLGAANKFLDFETLRGSDKVAIVC